MRDLCVRVADLLRLTYVGNGVGDLRMAAVITECLWLVIAGRWFIAGSVVMTKLFED